MNSATKNPLASLHELLRDSFLFIGEHSSWWLSDTETLQDLVRKGGVRFKREALGICGLSRVMTEWDFVDLLIKTRVANENNLREYLDLIRDSSSFTVDRSIPFGNKIRGERGLVFTYSENYKHEPLYTISLVVYDRDGRASQ